MSLLTKANVKEHCRTCLKVLKGVGASECRADDELESKNLYFNICNDPELQQLICITVDDPSTSDSYNPVFHNFPENVCLSCYNKLYSFAVFRRRAQQSAEKLRAVLNCSGNIKLEIHFEEYEDEPPKNESMRQSAQECKFQLHDATAESEEAFFGTSIANLADVEINDDTVDPFSPSAPSISEGSDREIVERDVSEKYDLDKGVKGKEYKEKSYEEMEVEEKIIIQKEKIKKIKPSNVVNKDKYRCPQCNQGFAKNTELTDHVNQVHAVGSTPFLCDHCDKSYRNLRSLKEHVLESHQDEIKAQVHFQCTECPIAFLDKSAMKKHVALHFTQKKTRVCGICGERFAVKKWLVNHLRTHTPDGRIPCAQCDKTYSAVEVLEDHERSVHLKEKPHYCQICDKSFQNKQSFRIHNYRHSGKKPYLCDICGKDFRQRTPMKTHRLIHFKNVKNN